VGLRADLDTTVAKRKKSLAFPCRDSDVGRPDRSVVTVMSGHVK
jgi:hypothetical protein